MFSRAHAGVKTIPVTKDKFYQFNVILLVTYYN